MKTAEVGGDWYDVICVDPDGPVDVVVGDVQGHDGAAAALMARLSSVIRASAGRGQQLLETMAETDRFLLNLDTERLASVLLARVSDDRNRVELLSAGHPRRSW